MDGIPLDIRRTLDEMLDQVERQQTSSELKPLEFLMQQSRFLDDDEENGKEEEQVDPSTLTPEQKLARLKKRINKVQTRNDFQRQYQEKQRAFQQSEARELEEEKPIHPEIAPPEALISEEMLRLTEFKEDRKPRKKPTVLNFDHQQLAEITLEAFKEEKCLPHTLRTLNLRHNQFKSTKSLESLDLPRLVSLDLSFNCISKLFLSISASHFPNLEHLNLSHNRLQAIELDQFLPVSKLKSLNLSYNQVTSVAGVVAMAELETLNLEGNSIGKLIVLRCLSFCKKLKHLWLQMNPVEQNDKRYRVFVLGMLPNLEQLDAKALPRARALSVKGVVVKSRKKGKIQLSRKAQKKKDTKRSSVSRASPEVVQETREPRPTPQRRYSKQQQQNTVDRLMRYKKAHEDFQQETRKMAASKQRHLNSIKYLSKTLKKHRSRKHQSSTFTQAQSRDPEQFQQTDTVLAEQPNSSEQSVEEAPPKGNITEAFDATSPEVETKEALLKDIVANVNLAYLKGLFLGFDDCNRGSVSLAEWSDCFDLIHLEKQKLNDQEFGVLLSTYLMQENSSKVTRHSRDKSSQPTPQVNYRSFLQDLEDISTSQS